MNTWDKTSLFRLSFAVQRRFAVINVGIPSDGQYAKILERVANEGMGVVDGLDGSLLARVQGLFTREHLLGMREVGPAVARDMVNYLRTRESHGDGLAEAIEMFLLPQLQGLSDAHAGKMRDLCVSAAELGASEDAKRSLKARFSELFPTLGGVGS
jgi:hypothetical protein